jgi:YD repeat-containing protein
VAFSSSAADNGADLNSFIAPYHLGGRGLAEGISHTTTTFDRLGRSLSQTTTGATRLTGSVQTTSASQTVDRWGNVLSASRNGSERVRYRYNANNQVTTETLLAQDNWQANGVKITQDLTKQIYYDAWGRNIGNIDAADKANAASYTVHGQLEREYHADGGQVGYGYDNFGRQTSKTDAIGRAYGYAFDRMDRERSRSVSYLGTPYGLGSSAYDALGRKTRELSGEDTAATNWIEYSYDARGLMWSRSGSGVTQVWHDAAGRKTQETDANGLVATWGYDATGWLTAHKDIGDATYSYSYNRLGQLKTQTNSRGQNLVHEYFEDGKLKRLSDNYRRSNTLYDYDADGNRTRETLTDDGVVYRNVTSSYDSQGRLSSATETAPGVRPDANTTIYTVNVGYDAAGNRRRVWGAILKGGSENVNGQTQYNSSNVAHDQWFTYDGMNRVRIDGGQLSGNTISEIGAKAVYSYDSAGRRRQEVIRFTLNTYTNSSGWRYDYDYDFADRLLQKRHTLLVGANGADGGTRIEKELSYWSSNQYEVTHAYLYNTTTRYKSTFDATSLHADGRIRYVKSTSRGYAVYTDGAWTTNTAEEVNYEQFLSYDNVGNLTKVWVQGWAAKPNQGYNIYQVKSSYYASDSVYRYSYYLMEGYRERGQALTGSSRPFGGNTTNFDPSYSAQSYDANGNLAQLNRTSADNSWLVTDNAGHIVQRWNSARVNWGSDTTQYSQDASLKRWELDANNVAVVRGTSAALAAMPSTPGLTGAYRSRDTKLFVNDQQIGQYEYSYSRDTEEGITEEVQYWQGSFDVAGLSDVNRTEGSAQYVTTSQGDTLGGLAHRLYGDSALWYVIAEANTLGTASSSATIEAGRVLKIPNVVRSSNTATSFAVYEPSKTIGNTSPDVVMPPPPPPKKGCGVLGTILMIVVAVVVTIYTAGAAAAYFAPAGTTITATGAAIGTASTFSTGLAALGGGLSAGVGGAALTGLSIGAAAIGGAVGSIASQGFGLAIGAIDKFSWNSVALGALGAGVTAGLGSIGGIAGQIGLSGNTALAVNAAASNAITQGIAVATGLQNKFDWRAVATSAIAAPVAKYLGDEVGGVFGKDNPIGDFARRMTSGIVTQRIRMAVYNKGKLDYASIAADAFGNALGEGIVAEMTPRTQGVGPWSDKNYENSFDIQDSNAVMGRQMREFYGPDGTGSIDNAYDRNLDADTPLPRTADGRVILPSGRVVRPGVDVNVREAAPDFAADTAARRGASALRAASARASLGAATPEDLLILGQFPASQRIDSGLMAFAPSGLTKRDGSPVTYSFNERTGQAYWNLGEDNLLREIPKAFKQPSLREAAFADPNNPFANGPRMGNVLAEFGVGSVAGGFALSVAVPAAAGLAADVSALGLRGAYYANGAGIATTGVLAGELAIGWNAIAPSAGLSVLASEVRGGLRSSGVVAPETVERYLIERLKWSPTRAQGYVESFEGPITARITRPGEQNLRYFDGPDGSGNFLTRSEFASPVDARRGLNLDPLFTPNTATSLQTVTTIGRSVVFEGAVRGGSLGVQQTVIGDKAKFLFGPGYRYY